MFSYISLVLRTHLFLFVILIIVLFLMSSFFISRTNFFVDRSFCIGCLRIMFSCSLVFCISNLFIGGFVCTDLQSILVHLHVRTLLDTTRIFAALLRSRSLVLPRYSYCLLFAFYVFHISNVFVCRRTPFSFWEGESVTEHSALSLSLVLGL